METGTIELVGAVVAVEGTGVLVGGTGVLVEGAGVKVGGILVEGGKVRIGMTVGVVERGKVQADKIMIKQSRNGNTDFLDMVNSFLPGWCTRIIDHTIKLRGCKNLISGIYIPCGVNIIILPHSRTEQGQEAPCALPEREMHMK